LNSILPLSCFAALFHAELPISHAEDNPQFVGMSSGEILKCAGSLAPELLAKALRLFNGNN
jgi:hypothetical protein